MSTDFQIDQEIDKIVDKLAFDLKDKAKESCNS